MGRVELGGQTDGKLIFRVGYIQYDRLSEVWDPLSIAKARAVENYIGSIDHILVTALFTTM
jgi:hypothetical protein